MEIKYLIVLMLQLLSGAYGQSIVCPDPVSNVSICVIDNTSVIATWVPPSSPTASYIQVELTDATPNGLRQEKLVFNNAVQSFTDLHPYKNYTITVYPLCLSKMCNQNRKSINLFLEGLTRSKVLLNVTTVDTTATTINVSVTIRNWNCNDNSASVRVVITPHSSGIPMTHHDLTIKQFESNYTTFENLTACTAYTISASVEFQGFVLANETLIVHTSQDNTCNMPSVGLVFITVLVIFLLILLLGLAVTLRRHGISCGRRLWMVPPTWCFSESQPHTEIVDN